MRRGKRATRLGRLKDRVVATLHIYYIPCVKHIIALVTTFARGAVSVAFAFSDPRGPLNYVDLLVLMFIASALLHEMRQLRRIGAFDYWELDSNRMDMAFIVVYCAAVAIRL